MEKIILASGSPRRKEILSKIFENFEIITSDCDENISFNTPAELVERLSKMKAEKVLVKLKEKDEINYNDIVIIGADTVVAKENTVYGKPADKRAAYNMIKDLSGNFHFVYTGICIIIKNKYETKTINFSEKTKVNVVCMSKKEIDAYVETDEPYDKAGAYAIQGSFAKYISKIEGDYYNIVGFPLAGVYSVLKKEGIINY